MKTIIRNSLATLAVACLAINAHAALITGAISIAGGATYAGGNINTATAFTTLGPAIVTSYSGTFASSSNIVLFSTSLTMNAFGYGTSATPAYVAGSTPTWTTPSLSGVTTSFTLTSINLVDHNINDQVTLLGVGVFKMTGFDDTIGSFNLTANQGGSTFSFSASQVAYAPDGGSTAILLGLGLGFLGFAARRFKAI
jgi:hypothetical protein